MMSSQGAASFHEHGKIARKQNVPMIEINFYVNHLEPQTVEGCNESQLAGGSCKRGEMESALDDRSSNAFAFGIFFGLNGPGCGEMQLSAHDKSECSVILEPRIQARGRV